MIAPHHKLRIRLTLFVQTIEAILPHMQEISWCPPRALITRGVVKVGEVTQERDMLFIDLECIERFLMLRIHPVGVAAFNNNLGSVPARGNPGRKVASW